MDSDAIGEWTQADLRRFIVNLLASDPGAVPVVKPKNLGDDNVNKLSPSKITMNGTQLTASANLTVTTAAADVAGCTFTAPTVGVYLAIAVFDVSFPVNTGNDTMFGFLNVRGADLSAALPIRDPNLATGMRYTITGAWVVSANQGDVLKLRASRGLAAGTCQVTAQDTTLTVLRIG